MPVSFGNGTLAKGGGGTIDPTTGARITTLENVQNEYEIYYSIASGTSGNATIPTGSSIVAAQYGTANGLLVQVDATGKPTDIAARTAAGAVVTVTLNTGTGAYTLSGAPSAYPVALVYQVLCSAKDAANIPVASIIDWTVAKGTMSTQNADAVAITGGTAAVSRLAIGSSSAFTNFPSSKFVAQDTSGTFSSAFYAPDGASFQFGSTTNSTSLIHSPLVNQCNIVSSTPGAAFYATYDNIFLRQGTGSSIPRATFTNSFSSISGVGNVGFGRGVTDLGAGWRNVGTGPAFVNEITSTGVQWRYSASGLDGQVPSLSTLMSLLTNGNLGIGTDTPTEKLDVRGNATFTGNATARQTAEFTNTGGQVYVGVESSAGGAVFTSSSAYAGVFGTNTATALHLATNGAVRATVDTSGNLGVGTVTPGQKISAAGIIESTSGGFKFPDGTIQTTASTGGGGGSSVEIREASVVVTPAKYYDATVSVSDPLVSTSSKILANLVPSADWDADDLADYSVTAKVDDGVIYFIINGPGPIVGTFNINYLWTGNPV